MGVWLHARNEVSRAWRTAVELPAENQRTLAHIETAARVFALDPQNPELRPGDAILRQTRLKQPAYRRIFADIDCGMGPFIPITVDRGSHSGYQVDSMARHSRKCISTHLTSATISTASIGRFP